MENINQRVFNLIGEERGAISKISKALMLRDSTVSNWKNRGSEIPAKYIPKIAEYLNVTESYLLTGQEEQPKNDFFSQEEIALIMSYRNLEPTVKEFVFSSISAGEKLAIARKNAEVYKDSYKQVLSAQSELAK